MLYTYYNVHYTSLVWLLSCSFMIYCWTSVLQLFFHCLRRKCFCSVKHGSRAFNQKITKSINRALSLDLLRTYTISVNDTFVFTKYLLLNLQTTLACLLINVEIYCPCLSNFKLFIYIRKYKLLMISTLPWD